MGLGYPEESPWPWGSLWCLSLSRWVNPILLLWKHSLPLKHVLVWKNNWGWGDKREDCGSSGIPPRVFGLRCRDVHWGTGEVCGSSSHHLVCEIAYCMLCVQPTWQKTSFTPQLMRGKATYASKYIIFGLSCRSWGCVKQSWDHTKPHRGQHGR